MKKLICIIALAAITTMTNANPVSTQRAIQVAQQFVPISESASQAPSRSEAQPAIVYTHSMPKSGQPAFYIVNVDGAFVLVSADDIAHPVLGYNLGSSWPTDRTSLPAHVKSFFDDLAAQIEAAKEAEHNVVSSSEWTQAKGSPQRRTMAELPDSVGPLLITTWGQGQYYNSLCPSDPNGQNGHTLTGCVATALAQIINYWGQQVPKTHGVHRYESNYGTLTVNYDSAYYDFAQMPNQLTATSTPQQINSVAQLMFHCGVATNMTYGPSESGTYDQEARAALINFFRFSPSLSLAEKNNFSTTEWQDMIRQNLSESHPILYSGRGDQSAHTFICDGYKTDNYFHFNFGWSGLADGWYLLSAISPTQYEFNSKQSAIMGIVPDSTGNAILCQMKGSSDFIVNQPIELYHLNGNSRYTGTDFSNTCNSTINLTPADTSTQLVVDILDYQKQSLYFYDGDSTMLRQLVDGVSNDLSPFISAHNKLTINYSGKLFYDGFHVCISQDNGCRMVSNVKATVDATTINLSWHENGDATQWQIEYGTKGFELGNGTLITANDTVLSINNLEKFTEYEFYIRPICGGRWFGISVKTIAPHWTDVVVSQPNGYVFDGVANRVEVSTPEGLAWWAKQHTVRTKLKSPKLVLTADIDLAEYLWEPVFYFFGSIDGQGHIIKNMRVIEREKNRFDGVGFIRLYSGFIQTYRGECDTIQDLHFWNAQLITPRDYSGIIAGSLFDYQKRTAILNCSIENSYVEGEKYVGLLGGNWGDGVLVENCYATGEVHGSQNVGGLIGSSNANLSNCWSSITNITATSTTGGWCGLITGYKEKGNVENCYVDSKSNINGRQLSLGGLYSGGYSLPLSSLFGYYTDNGNISNTSIFVKNDSCATLLTPICIDTIYSDLTSALNAYVYEKNKGIYKTWLWNRESSLPNYGSNHVVECSNVDSLMAKIVSNDGNSFVVLTWKSDNVTSWQVRVTPLDTVNESPFYRTVFSPVDTIVGLTLQNNYYFSVRKWCDNNHHSGWYDNILVTYDKPYWTDVVENQPVGYEITQNGNVKISSAEGLAWLSKVVNGLTGEPENDFHGKTIQLQTDVDLGGYRWYPLGNYAKQSIVFKGNFDGNGHTISNLYCSEKSEDYDNNGYLGLFGRVVEGTISNTKMMNAYIDGTKNIGALVGVVENSIIHDCSANGIVRGIEGVGGLIGCVTNANPVSTISPAIFNCSFRGDIYGSEDIGGLMGGAVSYVTPITNVYTICNLYQYGTRQKWGEGGLIGVLGTTLKNGYSVSTLHYERLNYSGIVFGSVGYGSVSNLYYYNNDPHLRFATISNGIMITDTSSIISQDTAWLLSTPIKVDGITYTNMLDALNAEVVSLNNPDLRLWTYDSLGFLDFGNYYVPTCYTPENIQALDLTTHRDSSLIKVSWTKCGNHVGFEVQCSLGDSIIQTIYSDSAICLITGLPLGYEITIKVRAICDSVSITPWSFPTKIIAQCPYWTDIVKSEPEGFTVIDKKIYISTAEDFAWLSSIYNNINGTHNSHYPINEIILLNDIDLYGYRWKPIAYFYKTLDGRNHTIKNFYIDETSSSSCTQVGFSEYNWGLIKNLNISDAFIKSDSKDVGCFAGSNHDNAKIINCSFKGEVQGNGRCAGLAGTNHGSIENCYSRIQVTTINHVSGYGLAGLVSENYGLLNNCFVTGYVENMPRASAISTYNNQTIYNCFSNILDSSIRLIHNQYGNATNISTFSIDNNLFLLEQGVVINDSSYTDLLSALNAWVDANNSEGIYYHWAADSLGVNGGFPIFAPTEEAGPATQIANQRGEQKSPARKVMENGMLYILLPDGTRYNVTGQRVK